MANPPILRAHLNRDGRTVRIRCPYCGQQHVHGAADLRDGSTQHRLAHCVVKSPASSAGYLLQIVEARLHA